MYLLDAFQMRARTHLCFHFVSSIYWPTPAAQWTAVLPASGGSECGCCYRVGRLAAVWRSLVESITNSCLAEDRCTHSLRFCHHLFFVCIRPDLAVLPWPDMEPALPAVTIFQFLYFYSEDDVSYVTTPQPIKYTHTHHLTRTHSNFHFRSASRLARPMPISEENARTYHSFLRAGESRRYVQHAGIR